jgi:hypothetical protein
VQVNLGLQNIAWSNFIKENLLTTPKDPNAPPKPLKMVAKLKLGKTICWQV